MAGLAYPDKQEVGYVHVVGSPLDKITRRHVACLDIGYLHTAKLPHHRLEKCVPV